MIDSTKAKPLAGNFFTTSVGFQCTWIQSHGYEYTWGNTFLTLTALLVHWKSSECFMHQQKCWQQTAGSSTLILSGNASTHTIFAVNRWMHQPASKMDSDIMKIPAVALSMSPYPALTLSETVAKHIDVLFCHSYQSASSANRCVFGWSYYCLSNENGNCWPQRKCMGDKTDRPPQLTWKTARFLSQSMFEVDIGSSLKPG